MTKSVLLGIDIGGTKMRIATAEEPHKILDSTDIPTPRQFAVAQQLLIEGIRTLTDKQTISAIGIASPGPVDSRSGTIGKATNLSWHRAPIVDWIRAYYPIPTILMHDAQAGGVCEARYGSGAHSRYVLYVSISTGIGSALILDGQPLPGPHNPEGGRIVIEAPTHSQLLSTYEQRGSGTAIVKKYGKRAADLKRRQEWDDVAYEIALGLYNLIVACDPEVVVLGGGVAVHFKKFIRPLQAHLKKLHPLYHLPPIKQAQHTEHAPLIGCLAHAQDALTPTSNT